MIVDRNAAETVVKFLVTFIAGASIGFSVGVLYCQWHKVIKKRNK